MVGGPSSCPEGDRSYLAPAARTELFCSTVRLCVFCEALHRSALPGDFGQCLDQAIDVGARNRGCPRDLVWQAYWSLHDPPTLEGLTLEGMRERLRGTPTLAAHPEGFSERRSSAEDSMEDDYLKEVREA